MQRGKLTAGAGRTFGLNRARTLYGINTNYCGVGTTLPARYLSVGARNSPLECKPASWRLLFPRKPVHSPQRLFCTVTAEEKETIADKLERAGKLIEQGREDYLVSKYPDSIKKFTEALELKLDIFGKEHLSIVELYRCLGDVYYGASEFESALVALRRASAILKDINNGEENEDVFDILVNITQCQGELARGEPETKAKYLKEAIASAQELLRIAEKLYTRNSQQATDALYAIGESYCLLGEHKRGVHYLEEAGQWYIKTQGYASTDAMTCWNNIASCYQTTNQVELAQKAYDVYMQCQSALKDKLLGDKDIDHTTFAQLKEVYKDCPEKIKEIEDAEKVIMAEDEPEVDFIPTENEDEHSGKEEEKKA